MTKESPRRRVRRAQQTRQVSHPVPGAGPERMPGAGLPGEVAETVAVPGPEPVSQAEPLGVDAAAVDEFDVPEDELDWDAELGWDDAADGSWLPAGIAVMVMVGLLICAGLVLIAAGKN